MAFPHSKLDLSARLDELLQGHTKAFQEALAQQATNPVNCTNGTKGNVSEAKKDPSYSPEHPEECCPHCGARLERGDDGQCNRCGKNWPLKECGHWVRAKKGKPGSILLYPKDRDKFIKWGKRKIQEARRKPNQLGVMLETLRPQLAAAAQAIYDAWQPDEENSEGGICDEIADAMAGVIADNIDCRIDDGGHEGDDHAFLIVTLAKYRYWVDIPAYVYETGGGYKWQKIPDVLITPQDIVIEPI